MTYTVTIRKFSVQAKTLEVEANSPFEAVQIGLERGNNSLGFSQPETSVDATAQRKPETTVDAAATQQTTL